MLPKKKTASQGAKTRKVSMLSTANGRLAASALTSISGSSVLRSTSDERAEQDEPDDDRAEVAGSPQPHSVDCWIPSTVSPIPTTIRNGPAPVDPAGVASSFELDAAELDQREQRHRHVDPEDRAPGPVLGQVGAGDRPDRGEQAGDDEEDARAPCRARSGGKALSTSTVAEGISRPPPTPCMTRKKISQARRLEPSGTSPHISELRANTTTR